MDEKNAINGKIKLNGHSMERNTPNYKLNENLKKSFYTRP
tara:strand:- start:6 stop:125 length:120 start_codon:yes stop_codon:yes gene_type:complete